MAYTESDTRAKLIDPQIKSSDWLESHIVREYYFTDGRKLIGGKRGQQYYVDYLSSSINSCLSFIKLNELKIPFPSLLIQQKVVKYLDEISEKTEKVKSVQKKKMDSLKALKASVLDRALRGEL